VVFPGAAFFITPIETVTMDDQQWNALLDQARQELRSLPTAERTELTELLAGIAEDQIHLDRLFAKAAGEATCAECLGGCCGCGRHHLTLANLLAYLCHDLTPPTPDFSRTCPFLGEHGCLLPASKRPYNCITFLCEALEDRLSPDEQVEFYRLEKQLRSSYEKIAERYPAASLRGVWIALERHGCQPLLQRKTANVVEYLSEQVVSQR
jgi:hypothetical protein